MKRMKQIFLVFSLAFGLCACQQTPEQVKQNMAEYGENKQVEQSEITYCTVDELRNAQMPDVDMGVATLPERVDFSAVEGVEVLHLIVEKDFLSEPKEKPKAEKCAQLFGLGLGMFEKKEDDAWGGTIRYDDEKGQYMNISENGGMAQGAGFGYDPVENVVEHMYQEGEIKSNTTEVNIQLDDGTVNLAQFCQDTEQWLEEHMAVGGGVRYKVSDAYVRKRKAKGKKAGSHSANIISLCAEYDYKGIRLNNHTMSLSKEDEEFNTIPITTQLFTIMDFEKKEMPCFFSRNVMFHLDSSEPVEKIVDLASAVRIVKEKLSGFDALHFTKVTPLYVPYVGDKGEGPGAEIEARPVYAFLIEKEQKPQMTGIVKSNSCHNFLYVDMVTGELTAELGNQ